MFAQVHPYNQPPFGVANRSWMVATHVWPPNLTPSSPLGFPDSCGKCALGMSSSNNGWVAGNLQILTQLWIGKVNKSSTGDVIVNLNWWYSQLTRWFHGGDLVIFKFLWAKTSNISSIEHIQKWVTIINQIWWMIVLGPPANQWLMLWGQRKIWSLRICQTTFQDHQNTLSWELKWCLPTMYGTSFSLASATYGYLVFSYPFNKLLFSSTLVGGNSQ